MAKFVRMKKGDTRKLKKTLAAAKEIVIVTHRNPDGDAIGSSLGLWNVLTSNGKKATVVTPNDFPDFLKWMKGAERITCFDAEQEKAKKIIARAELIFCLDFSTLRRIEALGEEVRRSRAFKVLVDHHVQPENFHDFIYHDVRASSTAQLICELLGEMGEKNNIRKAAASCLYAGMMTDTLCFRIPTVDANTYRLAAELVEAGAEPDEIYENVFSQNTRDSMQLLGYSLVEKMKVLEEYNSAYIFLSAGELRRFNFRKGDTEGLVNYPLSIKGIRFSVLFMELEGKIKISLRSKGRFDVNKMARAHFNGGGHVNAAGGDLKLSLEDSVKMFLEVLPQYKNELLR